MRRREFLASIPLLSISGMIRLQDRQKPLLLICVEHPTMQQVDELQKTLKELCPSYEVAVLTTGTAHVVGQASTFYGVWNGCRGYVRDASGTKIDHVQWVETSAELVGVLNRKTLQTDVFRVPGVQWIPKEKAAK